jgi:hypothetical protein
VSELVPVVSIVTSGAVALISVGVSWEISRRTHERELVMAREAREHDLVVAREAREHDLLVAREAREQERKASAYSELLFALARQKAEVLARLTAGRLVYEEPVEDTISRVRSFGSPEIDNLMVKWIDALQACSAPNRPTRESFDQLEEIQKWITSQVRSELQPRETHLVSE